MQSLQAYPWTSYPHYLHDEPGWINTSEVLSLIGSTDSYTAFVSDQVEYAKTLSDIRHKLLEDDEEDSN
jgi:hypothetical protein